MEAVRTRPRLQQRLSTATLARQWQDKSALPAPKAQAQPSMELLAGAFVPGGSSSLTQEIQKQLTSARRADRRLRKPKEEQETRTQHGKAYEADMKRKFSKQKRLFETDLERIAQEVQQAAAQGQQAAQNVKDLVNLGKIAETEPMEDEDDAWATLVREDEEDAQDSYLGAALRAAHQSGTASTDARQSGLAGPSGAMMGPDPFATQWRTCWWAAWHGGQSAVGPADGGLCWPAARGPIFSPVSKWSLSEEARAYIPAGEPVRGCQAGSLEA